MASDRARRYALIGEAKDATSLQEDQFEDDVERTWFSAAIDRRELKALMRRTDSAGYRHFLIWLVVLLGSGLGVIQTWRSWWSIPFLLVYGVMYSMSDHHTHELMHGTPFRNHRVNEVLLHLNGFMTLHEPRYWRWSHTRHHTHTMLVGSDPEIALKRPPSILTVLLEFFFIPAGLTQLKQIALHAAGRIGGDAEHFVPESERRLVFRLARVYLLIIIMTVAACIFFGSVLPALLIITPRFYGGFVAWLFNSTQHAGLSEDAYDHRLNSRTFLANPLYRFLYMNMNYHVEHHMFPMVPFHALPRLHAVIKDQCPLPKQSVWAAWREFIPALRRQMKDPSYFIMPMLPDIHGSADPA